MTKEPKKTTNKKIVALATLCLGGLIIANVTMSAKYATSGEVLKEIELEKAHVFEANQDLQRTVLEQTSLQALQIKADNLGFHQPVQLLTINPQPAPVAFSQ